MSRNLWIVFTLASFAYLGLMHSGLPLELRVALKLVPVATLLLMAFRHAPTPRYLYFALAFSAGGDFFLALPLQHGFVLGLGSFLVAQLTYAGGFIMARSPHLSTVMKARIGAVLVYSAILSAILLPATGELLLPVSVYLVAISLMACSAALHHRYSTTLFAGALVFVASDTMIAVDKFLVPFEGARYAIMATYYTAQGLITWSILTASGRNG